MHQNLVLSGSELGFRVGLVERHRAVHCRKHWSNENVTSSGQLLFESSLNFYTLHVCQKNVRPSNRT
jgi:hypothetical protein